VTIRAASAHDAANLAAIVRASYEPFDARHVPADLPIYRGEFLELGLRDEETRWVILHEDGVPAGMAMWRIFEENAHLHMLFVAGGHQGRGHGVRLLKHHQLAARQALPRLRLLTLHCLRDSAWAMRFYRHNGYAEYRSGDEGRLTDLYLWIDACRRHDGSWPLPSEKALFYRLTKGKASSAPK
jgi:ribosomal protein S18 acetylase RimI-like enzyme